MACPWNLFSPEKFTKNWNTESESAKVLLMMFFSSTSSWSEALKVLKLFLQSLMLR